MAHKLNKRAARQRRVPMFANWACGDFLPWSVDTDRDRQRETVSEREREREATISFDCQQHNK